MSIISELVEISKYAGERFDLVQAGGGNTSVKDDKGYLYIKSSGITLSQISQNKGFVKLNNNLIKEIFNSDTNTITEQKAKDILKKANQNKSLKPSIETFMHSFLPKYVLHSHPIAVNILMADKNWYELTSRIFPDAILVPYKKPGLKLAYEIYEKIKNSKKNRLEIFLQNHGLIVASELKEKIMEITDNIVEKLENYLNLDFLKYRLTNKISKVINRYAKNQISYLSENILINRVLKTKKSLFFAGPFCPDVLVYNGFGAVELKSLSDEKPIEEYLKKVGDVPKVIIYKNMVFLIAEDILKAKKSEDILQFNLMVLSSIKSYNPLKSKDIKEIVDWEDEIYRKNI